MSGSEQRRKISAILIVQNESSIISRCLNSLSWCDEIVVVDGVSTDSTKFIVCNPSAEWAPKLKWFERKWSGFKDQRNYALDQASNDWILSLDADEECSFELKNKLLSILSEPNPHPTWKVRRQEYFLGKEIHYGVWNPSYQDRFFLKSGVRYRNEIHEYPEYPTEPKRIHEPIRHWPGFNPDRFLEKMNKYTSIEARDRVLAGQRTNLIHLVTAGPSMFFKNYFYYKSYLDGVEGIVISILEGISRAVRHVKIWRYQTELEKTGKIADSAISESS